MAESAEVFLSTVKKIERGDISSFSSLLRILQILGKLDSLQSLVEEEQLSLNEDYNLVYAAYSAQKTRKRAVGRINNKTKEESE